MDFLDAGTGGEVPEELDSAGQGDDGNTFVFSEESWAFNLQTKNFDASGRYVITAVSGDSSEYLIDPACMVELIIE